MSKAGLTSSVTTTHSEPDAPSAYDHSRAKLRPATKKAYWRDFQHFGLWCQENDFTLLPAAPEAVVAYLTAQVDSGAKASTLARRCAAIRYVHSIGRNPIPTHDDRVKSIMRRIRRTYCSSPRPCARLEIDQINTIALPVSRTLTGLRNHALLLLGFAGKLTRSELVALDVTDVQQTVNGLCVTINHPRSAKDRRSILIAKSIGSVSCPVAAMSDWLRTAKITEGPLFRPIRRGGHVQAQRLTSRSVSNIIAFL